MHRLNEEQIKTLGDMCVFEGTDPEDWWDWIGQVRVNHNEDIIIAPKTIAYWDHGVRCIVWRSELEEGWEPPKRTLQ